MALDTYKSIWGKVLLRCPSASPLLAQDWVANAFRRVMERRPWSWLIKQGQFLTTDVYNDGTVSVTHNSTAVVGTGTAFTAAMVDRQFRISGNALYTVATVTDPTNIVLDIAYGGDTDTEASYEIYTAYGTAPTDFDYFVSVWDPYYNWQLHLDVTQRELNHWDAQRSYRGQAYVIAHRDYYTPSGSAVPPQPRFEIWPHRVSQYAYPYLYVSRATDIADSGATLPRFIRGDILLELALAEAARWPGDTANPNPYFDLKLALMHDQRAEFMLENVERQDEERNVTGVTYQIPDAWAPMDADFWQKHAF